MRSCPVLELSPQDTITDCSYLALFQLQATVRNTGAQVIKFLRCKRCWWKIIPTEEDYRWESDTINARGSSRHRSSAEMTTKNR